MYKILIASAVVFLLVLSAAYYVNKNTSQLGVVSSLTSSNTQNQERAAVNDLIKLVTGNSTTTANTWTGVNTFSAGWVISATSTGTNGIALTGGCFSVAGTCISAVIPAGTGTELQFRNGTAFGALKPSSFDPLEGDILIGTSSATGQFNLGLMTLGTSTEPQEVWSDNNPASALWAVRNSGGTLSFATSTLNATSSWNTLTLYPQGKAIIGLGVPNVVSATLQIYEQNGTGQSPSLLMGGNTGGDTDYWFGRNSNNDGLDNDTLQIGASSTIGSSTVMTLFNSTKVAFGTTTPGFSTITVSSSTQPQFSITDGVPANFAWTMRSVNSNFYLATSTQSATSTFSAFSISSIGNVTIQNALTAGTLNLTNPLTSANGGTGATALTGAFSVVSNTFSSIIQPSFTWYATSTTFLGTTTISLQSKTFLAATGNTVVCEARNGNSPSFLALQLGTGSASSTYMIASSTLGTVSLSSFSIAAGSHLWVDIATSTSITVNAGGLWLNCTYKITL